MRSFDLTFDIAKKRKFRRKLLAWYDANRRELPWRKDRDPYRVWVSEIMLQQTRVAAVIEHYHAFLKKFPSVEKLAAAREASVLASWSGLGYYRRARMMHRAAKVIATKHDGKFPSTAEAWRELPGIGRYTAAAIASIAFDQAVAVVDGNVERVLERMAGGRIEDHWELAEALLDASRPGDFNQAMMELGATVCLPRGPRCLLCPVREVCVTRGELPGQEARRKQKKREIHCVLDCRGREVFLIRRAASESLMPGMWELPQIAANGDVPWKSFRHSITVTDYVVRVIRRSGLPSSSIANDGLPPVRGAWVPFDEVLRLPLTGLARKILRAAEVI